MTMIADGDDDDDDDDEDDDDDDDCKGCVQAKRECPHVSWSE